MADKKAKMVDIFKLKIDPNLVAIAVWHKSLTSKLNSC